MAEQEDFYTILGVSRSASQDEIHKAWRKLAMKYHPDRNNGDKEAEEKLKKINVAHDVLSDPKKKEIYDQVGHEAFIHGAANGGPGGPGGMHFDFGDIDLQDIFGSFFGGGRSRQRRRDPNAPVPGENLSYELTITFEEAVYGADKDIVIPRQETCDSCHGSGCESGSGKKTCPRCNGSGMIVNRQGFFQMQTTCPNCHGSGQIIEKPCSKCHGNGVVTNRSKLTIHIPAGVDTGSRLRSVGNGNGGRNGGPAGDLFIILNVRPHTVFTRDGENLFCEIPIPFSTAALGGEVKVPTIDGEETLRIPEGTQYGAEFRLNKKGVPSLRRKNSRGDLYVRVIVEIPTNLGSAQKAKLKEFAASCSQVEYPKFNAFLNKIKSWFSSK